MKKLLSLIMGLVVAASVTGCSKSVTESSSTDEDSAQTSVHEITGGDVLILYFSANNSKDTDAVSSATPMPGGVSSVEWIADIIHENVGGDLVPIIPSIDYPLDYDELADYAKQEADNDERPAFENLEIDPTSYKYVFIGYPIWWYTVPKVMETFFETYDFSGVTIIPFNTHAGSGDGGTYDLIREREPGAIVKDGLSVSGNSTGTSEAETMIEQWLGDLNLE